jgi:biopolymer transport protein TolR
MKMSRRARRMERHHKRKRNAIGFNMVSLMDIFTILVFFLLVNSSDVEVLQSTKSIKLPESIAEQKPKETLVVMVSQNDILVQGHKVATAREAVEAGSDVIAPLKTELEYQARKAQAVQLEAGPFNGEVTILGDREIPYKLLKKIMVTCARSNYGKISLAVTNKAHEG